MAKPQAVKEARKAPRIQARKKRTRIRLLRAAHRLMSEKGIDSTTILEITELADVGFGTFYNYFSSKDDLAAGVLDCVIDALGRRNDLATQASGIDDPKLIIANSIRGVAREMLRDKMWRWWLKRPDLLTDRMREGFRPYAIRDIRRALEAGADPTGDPQSLWSMLIWLLAGRVIDIDSGVHSARTEQELGEAILRLLGTDAATARDLAARPLPALPEVEIDFSFQHSAAPDAEPAVA